jgi:hypothetical protein
MLDIHYIFNYLPGNIHTLTNAEKAALKPEKEQPGVAPPMVARRSNPYSSVSFLT